MTETTTTVERPTERGVERGAARDLHDSDGRRHQTSGGMDPLLGVRTADIEPYTGLRYLSKLFRMIAVVLMLLLIAEVVTGLYAQGAEALSTLLAEVSRLIVLAGLLWGAGDLAILLIDVGHDVRAARILLGRQSSHAVPPSGRGERVTERGAERTVERDGLA